MKLLMIAESRLVHTQRWAGALARRDWEVSLLSISQRPIPEVKLIELQIPPLKWMHPRRWSSRYGDFFRSTIDRVEADLVHVHYLHAYEPQGLLPQLGPSAPRDHRRQAPLVISTWGADVILDETVPSETKRQRRNKVILLRQADAVTATTHYLARQTAVYAAISPQDITVIPFGVDLDRYVMPGDWPKQDYPVVGFIKHLMPKYGAEVFIRAMPAVLQRFPRTQFVIIGEGNQEEALKQLADSLGLDRSIQWLGVVDNADVPAHLWGMDVMVMPSISTSETFGVVAVEAQAAAVPVVFSDLPGVREAITDGQGGLAVRPGHVGDLTQAICRLLGDDTLRQRLGKLGQQDVRRTFSFDDNVDCMERVYRDVLNAHPPSPPVVDRALSVAS